MSRVTKIFALAATAALALTACGGSNTTTPSATGGTRSRRPAGGGLRSVLGDRVFMTFAAVMFVYSVVYVQTMTTLPLAMAAQGLPPSSFGMLLTLNGLLLCALQLPSARLFHRWSRDVVIVRAPRPTG